MKKRISLLICLSLMLSLVLTTLTSCSLDMSSLPGSFNELISPVKVKGTSEKIYYTTPNQDVTVSVNINNRRNLAISSITVNGQKIHGDMLSIAYNGPASKIEFVINSKDEAGIHDFTIDSIEYVSSFGAKSVDITNKGFRLGVYVDGMVNASVTSQRIDIVDHDCAIFEFDVSDPYSLIEKSGGRLVATLAYFKPAETTDNPIIISPGTTSQSSDGTYYTEIFTSQSWSTSDVTVTQPAPMEIYGVYDVRIGSNKFTFEDLDPSFNYTLSITGQYDDLSGKEPLTLDNNIGTSLDDLLVPNDDLDGNVYNHNLCTVSFNTRGDFYFSGENKPQSVDEAIALALTRHADDLEKKYSGVPGKYDLLGYCYYATDTDGNVFYASKMDESKPTNIQVGLSSLEDINKAISDGVLTVEDIASHIYITSAAKVVGKGDVLSISYVKTWGEDGKETKSNAYFVVGDNNAFAEALIGKQVGVTLDEIKVTEKIDEKDVECTYTDVKVESIVKDNSTVKVADGDKVYLTYTYTFKATKNEETNEFEVPEGFDKTKIDAEGNYKATVSYELNTIVADPENATAEQKTFLGQLVGKTAGSTTSSISVKNGGKFDSALEGVEVKFTNVKVNWIVNSDTEGFEVKYTPYPEKLNANGSNEKIVINNMGEKIVLNGVELTYHIFPVYYKDVPDFNTEHIFERFIQTASYLRGNLLSVLSDKDYTYNGKTVTELFDEYVALYYSHEGARVLYQAKVRALNDAQSRLAKDDKKSNSETTSLKLKLLREEESMLEQKLKMDGLKNKLDHKLVEILSCTKNGVTLESELLVDFEELVQSALNK